MTLYETAEQRKQEARAAWAFSRFYDLPPPELTSTKQHWDAAFPGIYLEVRSKSDAYMDGRAEIGAIAVGPREKVAAIIAACQAHSPPWQAFWSYITPRRCWSAFIPDTVDRFPVVNLPHHITGEPQPCYDVPWHWFRLIAEKEVSE